MSVSTRTYHHGDLRNCAIGVAAQLVESSGSYDITITQVAKLSGVSAAALYRHFKDKEALVSAVAELIHRTFTQYLLAAEAEVERGTLAHFEALGSAYLRFAEEKRTFFRLMWEYRGNTEIKQGTAPAMAAGFQILLDAVELYTTRQSSPQPHSPMRTATLLWSTVHGIATLRHNHLLDKFDENVKAEELLKTATHAILGTD
ncbi:MAG: TetR/AcrR family transcriptional regulator [Halieaceae bacterium]|jgi:AcrR family transcriptional regulator|nr:TetR/AcrR family transcriptional regulator [Halieaceae bacterium]MBT6180774.1 TetR/AcrR family transcriptional regulator [Halieaceae bacterium]